MPKRIKADQEAILSSYLKTKCAAETARTMGLHVNTVRIALRRHKGDCVICGEKALLGKLHCAKHLKHLREQMREKRAKRRRAGLCAECDKPFEPPSNRYCAEHREKVIQRNEQYDEREKAKRGAPNQGKPNSTQRLRHIRNHYGEAGIKVWKRDNATCIVCATPYSQKAIHIHHIDGDDNHSTVENMVCLCFRCHRLTHLLIEHPSPSTFLKWIVKTYPLLEL